MPTGDAAFRALLGETRREIADLTGALGSGKVSIPEWGGIMLESLADAHARAGYHGRQRGGDTAPFDADDERFGRLAVQEEMSFLAAFEQDLVAGRYRREDGALAVEDVQRRAEMYLGRLYGTANEAMCWVADEALVWHLGQVDDSHCEACPKLAEGSPYPPGRWPTLPGMNRTPCLSRCACWVSTESGIVGFRPG